MTTTDAISPYNPGLAGESHGAGAPGTARSVVAATLRRLSHLWGVVAILVAWQLWVTVHHYNAIVMPSPPSVASDLVHHPGAYAGQLGFTAGLSMAGLAIGMAFGVGLALLVWASPLLSGLSTPVALVLRAVPVVAMIPVLGRLFGYNERTEVIVAALVCFFPAFVLTTSGLRRPPAGSRDVAAVLGSSRWRLLRHVLLPGALPGIAVALRLTAPLCVLAAMLAEFLMGTRGLGYVIATASTLFDTERSWGAAVLGTTLSVVLFLLAGRIERSVEQRWS